VDSACRSTTQDRQAGPIVGCARPHPTRRLLQRPAHQRVPWTLSRQSIDLTDNGPSSSPCATPGPRTGQYRARKIGWSRWQALELQVHSNAEFQWQHDVMLALAPRSPCFRRRMLRDHRPAPISPATGPSSALVLQLDRPPHGDACRAVQPATSPPPTWAAPSPSQTATSSSAGVSCPTSRSTPSQQAAPGRGLPGARPQLPGNGVAHWVGLPSYPPSFA